MSISAGNVITDGTAEFTVRSRKRADISNMTLKDIQQTCFDMANPVGKVLTLGIDDSLSTVFADYIANVVDIGTWEVVAEGRVLIGAGSGLTAGRTIEAGLPNISGYFNLVGGYCLWQDENGPWQNGATASSYPWGAPNSTAASNVMQGIWFNAKAANSIYGNSTTVQPPAYTVHHYQRIS